MLIALAMMVFFFVMVFGLEPNPGDASPPAALFGFMGFSFLSSTQFSPRPPSWPPGHC